MIYCISDIHGHYAEFMSLLEQIEFKSSDTLYMLGDAVDRGPESIKCLQFIMDNSNIHMLMGNHELMMLDAITKSEDSIKYRIEELWTDYNGGIITYQQYLALPEAERTSILDFLKGLPYYHTLKFGSKQYLLVHAGLDLSKRKPRERLSTTIKRQRVTHPNDMVWIREEFLYNPGLPSYTIIFGHTSSTSIKGHRKPTIWHRNGKIGIDCGCYKGGNLAALRLDDMKEFYVPKAQRISDDFWTYFQ